jgi:hypothetical protein
MSRIEVEAICGRPKIEVTNLQDGVNVYYGPSYSLPDSGVISPGKISIDYKKGKVADKMYFGE